jgi:hypothetical protein
MEASGPALPICSFCGHPKPIGTFSDDRKAYICLGCDAVAKQFLDIQASFRPRQRALVDEEAPDDRDVEGA